MSGYSRIYCIGGLGGFLGYDGINPIVLQVWVSAGNRQAWEGHAVDPSVGPLGELQVVIPDGPNNPNALIDSCLAFLPAAFESCPSLPSVRAELGSATHLDFDAHAERVPGQWRQLRREAYEAFLGLHIFEATLNEIDLATSPYGQSPLI